ncbi:PREDICTED: uncharacterized protein LOC106793868 [Polistes canadensis]|uniref:uncharacterized protein LOC106793868 n=1 Tax=Polistes canadensis TaxID=91411 RepID=UPI000718B3D0|nr:PREDICTED: uncharacterized protein LOC106793868 [Polistes canadensis]
MASMCGSSKSHPALTTSSYYRSGAYPYQSDYYYPPRSTWSRVTQHPTKKQNANSTWKIGSAMLIISAMLVLIAVLAIAGLALWLGALRNDSKNSIIGFTCNFRVIKGERYNPMLKLNTSMVFRDKERKYKNIFELLFRRSVLSPAYKQTIIDKFENGTLKVFFRLYLDRRKIPRSITNIEDTIEDIIAKETYSVSSLFKDLELDLASINVKRINQDITTNQKQTGNQQRNAMITKNGLLRPNRTSPLITGTNKPKSKLTKIESNEPEIDFNNIPTIQGTYKATKVNETLNNSTKLNDKIIESNITNVNKDSQLDEITNKSIISRIDNNTKLELTSVQPISSTTMKYKTTNKFEYTSAIVDNQKEMSLASIKISSSTIPSTSSVIIQDFHKPDFETSPWKPIVPEYVNTELKLLLDTTISSLIVNTDSIVKNPVYDVQDKIINDNNPKLPNKISENLEPINTRIDVSGMSTLDEEDTDFPHDRIVPEDMVNFRVNGKFKNKIPGLMDDGNLFTAPTPTIDVINKPSIEVSGQLPSETFDLRLSTSSGGGELTKTDHVKQHYYQTIIDQSKKLESINSTNDNKDDSNVSRWNLQTNKPEITVNDESVDSISGIGIAEPVPDLDENLETRSRLSGIEALDKDQNDALRDRKVDQRPIYTSYRSPDLSGSAIKSSLIENPGTIKPFRHTIPVDKITSAIFTENDNKRLPLISVNENTRITSIVDKIHDDDEQNVKEMKIQDKWITSMDIKEATEMIHLNNPNFESSFVKNEKIELTEPTVSTKFNNDEIIDDEKILKLGTTEIYSEILHPSNNNNNGQKLIMNNDDSKEVIPEKLISSVSRNSTFIVVDTVQHVPNQDNTDEFENTNSQNRGNDVPVNPHLTTTPGTRKKIYNDTLKAYVVENLVTLAPVKSNTGIGRPVRPRPKIDNDKSTKFSLKPSAVRSTAERLDETALLEQLFGLKALEINKNKLNRNISNEDLIDDRSNNQTIDITDQNNTRIEQIVEVVTSVSTKVSSKENPDRVVLRFVVTNSTSPPIIHTDSNKKSDKLLALQNNEEKRSFKDENPNVDPMTILTSDRKISTLEDDRFILNKLKQLAEVRTHDNKPDLKIIQNSSDLSMKNFDSRDQLQSDDSKLISHFDELKKIADVAVGNETLKNDSSLFTLSRDGVRILTKIMNKMDDDGFSNDHETKNLTTEKYPDSISDNCQGGAGFRCNDGKCLPSSARCNMLGECKHSEDEANCTCADFLKAQLLHQKICDGTPDCWDYSDETDCDWCVEGQFVCGNSRYCVDQNKVCDGFQDCPTGEDEKKCAALIEDYIDDYNIEQVTDAFKNNKTILLGNQNEGDDDMIINKSEDYSFDMETGLDDVPVYDQEAVESTLSKTSTIPDSLNKETYETVVETTILPDESTNLTYLISGREISSNLRNNLNGGTSYHAKGNSPITSSVNGFEKELNGYNDKGYLNIRKNGKWGKLCLNTTNNYDQERQTNWSIEDLARAVCKAITYQDYEKVEKVFDENPSIGNSYYVLSFNDDKPSDKTALTFKPSNCPSGEILKVKCKNLECGIRTQTPSQARIVGGGSSSAGSWPWQVALYKEGDYQCGGALINDKWVLSAAHCFYRTLDEYWVARIGATRRGSFPSPHEQLLRLDQIVLHPDYIDNGFINDIALLRLEKSVTFSDYVRPVCLPQNEPKSGTTCTVTGWGQLFEIGRIFPDTLQEVQLPLISTEECRRKTIFLPLYRITSGMLCAGLKDGGRDACLGDSGGPLVCSGSDNKYTIHGITSNGYGCARPGRPGVYTKVYHYLSYIERVINSYNNVPSIIASCKGHRCPLGECLPKSRICNGFLECSDGSDERDCVTNLR